MGTPASPFSDGSYSIDSRVNQDLGSRPARPRPHSPPRQPAGPSRSRSLSRSRSRDRHRRRRDRSGDRRRRYRSSSRDRRGRSRRDSRSRSRSRRTNYSSRSRQSTPPPPEVPHVFPKAASIHLASWMSVGQQATRTRELRESFKPVFEDETFNLACPKMDDVVERQIVRSRHGKFIGQRELIWKSTQLKVLDVARPLISLWSRIDPSTEEGRMLENAIELWAEAHFFISKNRRANVMNSVYPRFKNLLKDPSKFSPTEVSHLFGPTFTSALLQAADEDAKLQKVASSGRSGGSGQKAFQKRSDKPEEQRPGTSRHGEHKEKYSYQTRYVKFNSPSIFSVDHVMPCTAAERSPPSPVPVTRDSSPHFPTSYIDGQSVGARIKLFVKEWRSVNNDPWILQIVDAGFRIDFISKPFQSKEPGECTMGPQMEEVCDKEVADLLRKKAIAVAPDTPGFFSRIFAIPKKTGGYRPIIN